MTNRVLQIFDVKTVTGVSGPPNGFSKIWPDIATNEWKVMFSDLSIKRLLDTLEVDTNVFTLDTPVNTERTYKLNINLGSGLTSSLSGGLFVGGLTYSSLNFINSFTQGYVISASSSGDFMWIPSSVHTGDLNTIPKFGNDGDIVNSLIVSSGSNVYIGNPPNITNASFSVTGDAQFSKIFIGPNPNNFIEDNSGIRVRTNGNFDMSYSNGIDTSNIITYNPVGAFGSMSIFNGMLRFGNTPSNYFRIDGFTALTTNDVATFGSVVDPLETKTVASGRHSHKYNDLVSTTSSYSGLTLSFNNEFQIFNPTFGSTITISSVTGSAPGKYTMLRINSVEQTLTRTYNYIENRVVCGTAINGQVTVNGFTMTNSLPNLVTTGFVVGSVVFVGTQSFTVSNTISTTQVRLATTASILSPRIAILASPIETSIALNDVVRVGNYLLRVTGFSNSGGITHSFTVDSSNLSYYNQFIYRSNIFTMSSPGISLNTFGRFVPGFVNRVNFQCEDNNSINVYFTNNIL